MPNIHIHTDDDRVAGELVTYALSLSTGRIRVTIDNSDAHDTPNLAARAATETGRRLITSVLHAEESARAARMAGEVETYERDILMPCPHCHAAPTQPCSRPSGAYCPAPYLHKARRIAGFEAAIEDRIPTESAAARAATVWAGLDHSITTYCMCSHDEPSHATTGERACLADACSCPSWTPTTPFPPVTLDEM